METTKGNEMTKKITVNEIDTQVSKTVAVPLDQDYRSTLADVIKLMAKVKTVGIPEDASVTSCFLNGESRGQITLSFSYTED
jgi:hypothetical protein